MPIGPGSLVLSTARALQASMLALGVSFASVGYAHACAFDMIKPERTAIDWIVETETLVLARPSSGNRFAYEITEVLRGTPTAQPIDHLVNTIDRKRLNAEPEDSMLFAFDGTAWTRVALVDATFRKTLQTALSNTGAWFAAMPQSRIDFVETLQQSNDPRHKAIVIGELDKVPYEALRRFDLQISDDEILDLLWSREGYAYQAILALLLGISGTSLAQAEIEDYIDRVEDWDWANNLGAFAAAFIELEGVEGVDRLASGMLADRSQPLDKVEQVVMALSVHHALAEPEVKSAIQTAISDLLHARPETAALIARQFALRADWSQAALLEPMVEDRQFSTMQDLLIVSVYVAQAREQNGVEDGPENES